MNKKHSIDMLHGPITGKIIIFSIPIILSGILQLLYNAADVVVVGRYCGKESLAAVGSTGALINLFLNLFIGISTGVCVTLANSIGTQDRDKAERTVHTSILIAIICGILVGAAGYFLSRTMLELMNTPDDVIDKASLYLKIYFFGTPATIVYNFGSSLLRAIGDTKRPMFILIISGIVNVIFNLIFVIVFKMDVAGVALATAISQYISCIMILLCLITDSDYCHLNIRKLHIYKRELMLILKIGLPAGIQGCIFSVSNIQIQTAINSFGSAIMAGNTAASNLEGFVYLSMNAIYQAALTFTSQNFGAGDYERIKKIIFRSLAVVFTIGLVTGSLLILFSRPLLGIFSKEPQIIDYGRVRLIYICSAYFLCGIMDVLTGVMRGLNYSLVPMIVTILGVCGLRFIWIWFVFPISGKIEILYLSYPVSWMITALIHSICLASLYKRLRLRQQSA